MEINDNGEGFDATNANDLNSFGVFGMRERALALKAHFNIVSARGLGTTIALALPIDIEGSEE